MLVIDGSHLLHRAKYSTDKIDWRFYSYVFCRSLMMTVKKFRDRSVVVCWDKGLDGVKSVRRKSVKPSYKVWEPIDTSTKEGQDNEEALKHYGKARAWLHNRFLPTVKVGSIMIPGIEADDIAYSMVNILEVAPTGVLGTEDRDWNQSVRTGWSIYRPMNELLITCEDLMKEYEVDTLEAFRDKFVVTKAIIGDPSDGIDGVFGVGWSYANKFYKPIKEKSLLTKEVIDDNDLGFSGVKAKSMIESLRSGKVRENIKLISFAEITPDELNQVEAAYSSVKSLEMKNLLLTDWIDLAGEIDSGNMVDFGTYLNW